MNRERSRGIRSNGRADFGRGELQLADELAPLPDWAQLGRHILAEAMRRAMQRVDNRLARDATAFTAQTKELS